MTRPKNMTTDAKSTITPKRRFPEFRGGAEWSEHKLGEMAAILKGKGLPKADVDPSGSQPCIRYGELYTTYGELIRTVASRTKIPASKLFLSKSNDVIIPSSGETKIDIATAACVLLDGIALGGDLNVIRSKLDGSFLSYYLNGPKRFDIAKVAQGDSVVHLYPHQLEKLKIAVPLPAEQRKIAECLGTLDELIGAESQKFDALKTHKKGLMQQLFPREGETLPRLRFPEFHNAPEWVTKVSGDLFTNRKEDGEAGLPIYSVTINDGMVPRASFDRDFYDIADPAGNKKVCKGDIAYNMMRMWQGAQGVAPEDCVVSPAYVVLAPQDGVCAEFFAHFFKLPESLELLAATSRGLTKDRLRLYFDDFARMRSCVPELAEQQRIAACLVSVDRLVGTHRSKLESLKIHKRGLMQQLFPAMEAVSA